MQETPVVGGLPDDVSIEGRLHLENLNRNDLRE
jgi:hypothetical protein